MQVSSETSHHSSTEKHSVPSVVYGSTHNSLSRTHLVITLSLSQSIYRNIPSLQIDHYSRRISNWVQESESPLSHSTFTTSNLTAVLVPLCCVSHSLTHPTTDTLVVRLLGLSTSVRARTVFLHTSSSNLSLGSHHGLEHRK